jgi:hypothetical protein
MGGVAFIPKGETWPACPNCDKPMALVLQLDVTTLPSDVRLQYGYRGEGLIQFFNCTSGTPLCEVDTEAFFGGEGPKPKSKLLRLVRTTGDGAVSAVPEMQNPIEPKSITGWTALDDYPSHVEETGVENAREVRENVEETLGIDWYDASRGGDKLAGWPQWIQDVEYPSCKKCDAEMNRFVYQIASDATTNASFCGDGVAYVCQCPEHPDCIDELAQQ